MLKIEMRVEIAPDPMCSLNYHGIKNAVNGSLQVNILRGDNIIGTTLVEVRADFENGVWVPKRVPNAFSDDSLVELIGTLVAFDGDDFDKFLLECSTFFAEQVPDLLQRAAPWMRDDIKSRVGITD